MFVNLGIFLCEGVDVFIVELFVFLKLVVVVDVLVVVLIEERW